MTYIKIRTKQGERWDLLANEYWGDASLVPILIFDNQHIPIDCEIEAGMVLFIREEIEREEIEKSITTTTLTPPWRRQ